MQILNNTGAIITLDAAASESDPLRILTAAASVGSFQIDSLVFVNGYAPDEGGAIFAGPVTNAIIDNSSFIGVKSAGNGGALSLRGATTVYNCKFTNCTSLLSGGAIYAATVANLTVAECEFDSNIASLAGGAIAFSDGGVCSISGSSFWSNQALGGQGGDGGAIQVSRPAVLAAGAGVCQLVVLDSSFLYNYASKGGGGIGTQGSQIVIMVSCSDFMLNDAGVEGGAIYCSGGSNGGLLVEDCSFSFNTSVDGGAINNGSSDDSAYINSQFYYNSASNNAGVLFVKGGGGITKSRRVSSSGTGRGISARALRILETYRSTAVRPAGFS